MYIHIYIYIYTYTNTHTHTIMQHTNSTSGLFSATHTHKHTHKQHNWPLLRVSKGYFDGPAATEEAESHAALDGDIGGGWGGDDLDLGDDGEAKDTGNEGLEDGDEGAAEGEGGGGGETFGACVYMA